MTKYIGIPKETKSGEKRVALTPSDVARIIQSVKSDVEIFVTKGAGKGAGYSDEEYAVLGCRMTESNKETYILGRDLIVKVKEPTEDDVLHICSCTNVLSYIHAAALSPKVAPKVKEFIESGEIRFYGLELLKKQTGVITKYPGLIPMSEVAGEVAVDFAIKEWNNNFFNRFLKPKPKVYIFGLGTSGRAAIKELNKRGFYDIIGFDTNEKTRRYVKETYKIHSCYDPKMYHMLAKDFMNDANIIIGSVLVPGKQAPIVLDQEVLKNLKPRKAKNLILADIAIDQGGCLVENSPVTTHANPVIRLPNGVKLIAVPNLPAARPIDASKRLSAVLWPYVVSFIDETDEKLFKEALTKTEDVIIP